MVHRAPGPWGALGRIVSWGVAGVDPDIMGIGLNEAFAAQYLAVERELGVKHFTLPGRGRR